MKFAFIAKEKASHRITTLCRVLGVTRQGYYAFARRTPSKRALDDAALRVRIEAAFRENAGRYGSPRIHALLRRDGVLVGKRRVERVMRAADLRARTRRRFRVTTRSNPRHAVAPNVLGRDFTASRPDERWVSDITYVWTSEGWCYLAVVIDLFSRAVVGWSVDSEQSTKLPLRALQMAVEARRGGALLHHSDRGAQYTSDAYREALRAEGIEVSMSRPGNCWDNAVAESFFATLKAELVTRERRWTNRAELRDALFEYIHIFYNRRRLHSSLGFKTPLEVEHEHEQELAA